MSNQQMMLQPKQTIMLHGEKWELHKSATDSTIPFAYDRVKVESFACENIDNNVLYGKLDDYKTICFGYLLDKYGKEQLNEIIKEYNLEV